MRNRILKYVVPIIGLIITLFMIIWLLLSLCTEYDYFQIELKEWLTMFGGFELAFFISYYLTNIKMDYEKKLKTYEDVISKMQIKLREDPTHLFSKSMNNDYEKKWKFYQQELLLYFRALNNYYNLISQYKGDLDIQKELDLIKEHLDHYKFELTENVSNFESVRSKRSIALKEIDFLDMELDEIKIKLH